MTKWGSRNPSAGGVRVLLAIIGIAVAASAARGDLSDVVLWIEATTEDGAGVWEVHFGQGAYDGCTFHWSLDEPVDINDSATGDLIATLLPDLGEGTYVTVCDDPEVNLGFAVQAGSETTTFTLRSTLLTFDPLINPDAQAGVAVSLQDFNGDGATLTGIGPQNGIYLAQYNGFVPGGTTFAEQLTTPISAGMFETVNADENTGWQTISNTVSDISSQLQFTLTANDLASGTSNFEVVPEPASLLLLLVGVGLIRRR